MRASSQGVDSRTLQRHGEKRRYNEQLDRHFRRREAVYVSCADFRRGSFSVVYYMRGARLREIARPVVLYIVAVLLCSTNEPVAPLEIDATSI